MLKSFGNDSMMWMSFLKKNHGRLGVSVGWKRISHIHQYLGDQWTSDTGYAESSLHKVLVEGIQFNKHWLDLNCTPANHPSCFHPNPINQLQNRGCSFTHKNKHICCLLRALGCNAWSLQYSTQSSKDWQLLSLYSPKKWGPRNLSHGLKGLNQDSRRSSFHYSTA